MFIERVYIRQQLQFERDVLLPSEIFRLLWGCKEQKHPKRVEASKQYRKRCRWR
jgi:hypothetical protein